MMDLDTVMTAIIGIMTVDFVTIPYTQIHGATSKLLIVNSYPNVQYSRNNIYMSVVLPIVLRCFP